MARRSHDDALGVVGAETVIGNGVKIEGNIVSESDITIDGYLRGRIKTDGDVTVGVNAEIHGDIDAANISIAGSLTGNIAASGEATIRETGRVQGDIRAAALAISSGGYFIGTSSMGALGRGDVADTHIRGTSS